MNEKKACEFGREIKENAPAVNRRTFLHGAAASAAALALPLPAWSSNALPADDLDAIRKEIEKRHDESLRRLQTWIKQPSIAAENRGMNEGCELTMQMLREAGFQQVVESADGRPAGNFRHVRCRGAAHDRSLFHV